MAGCRTEVDNRLKWERDEPEPTERIRRSQAFHSDRTAQDDGSCASQLANVDVGEINFSLGVKNQ